MTKSYTANQIRKEFIEFFEEKNHTNVPSSSLVPAGDATLLFSNSGMVQFKDVFLGTDNRSYVRATCSQKCMRVAGKHNDLEDVGFDDSHHSFFEMLGNWSFGDYYKKEAIAWAWQLLTEVWDIEKGKLYITIFKDDKGDIPTDDEAKDIWAQQPGITKDHILFYGRKDNFWEMAATGPCGPNSEIHYDRGDKYGELTYLDDGRVDLDGPRFLELWNLVFIQYNRIDENTLNPLPKKHVDTGLGLERIVSVLQNKDSNYRTDLFSPILDKIQSLTGHSDAQVEEFYSPYRVIADHVRASTFLIADGVIPGNMGRNYVTRMVIRRAARFGSKLGLNEPFLAKVATAVLENYSEAYPELALNQQSILDYLTQEEMQFKKTIDKGLTKLETIFAELSAKGETIIDGEESFDLHATFGLPLEITKDIALEKGFQVDELGFKQAMENHRLASGGGKAMGVMDGQMAIAYQKILNNLIDSEKLTQDGVVYAPYDNWDNIGEVLAIVKINLEVSIANQGDEISLVLPKTGFYVAAGGQVTDTGRIVAEDGSWKVEIESATRPTAGIIIHSGKVTHGELKLGDLGIAKVDHNRRDDIRKNHTATHLLHAELQRVLGEHAKQAGSLVAPDKLRFDFQHGKALSQQELAEIQNGVNQRILENHKLIRDNLSLEDAIAGGATALFGEKYGETVWNLKYGEEGNYFSNELCGGTHVVQTSEINYFRIISEGSSAAGVRRIEAVTGKLAFEAVNSQSSTLSNLVSILDVSTDNASTKLEKIISDYKNTEKELATLRKKDSADDFTKDLQAVPSINDIPVLAKTYPNAGRNELREMADKFKSVIGSGVVVLATIIEDKPAMIAGITDDLVKKGFHAGELIKLVAAEVGGTGGGRPNLAQAGGKSANNLEKALALVTDWVDKKTSE
jgi:alanyl-tRNA synthetase